MKNFVLIYILLGLIVSISGQKRKKTSIKNKCYLTDIEVLNYKNCSGVDVGGKSVKHLGSCSTEGDTIITCVHGHWSGTRSSVGPLHREKRSWWILIGGGIVACLLFCDWGGSSGGGGRSQTSITHPPTFGGCRPHDLQENYNISAGKDSVIVKWTVPSATDKDNNALSVVQVAGGENGGQFDGTIFGKAHYIIYRATDSDGLTEHCNFNFTVTVLTCNTLPWHANGKRVCDNKHILGSSCQYTCNTGYQLNGISTVTCENEVDPSWSAIPICEKITCSAPKLPEHTKVQCSDTNYSYQSVCSMECDSGFALEGAYYIQCQANRAWSNIVNSSCVDNSPPTISCVTPQIFYADRGITSTLVKWQLPTAFDKTDEHPSIVPRNGPIWGTVLEQGTEIVKYTAVDVDGNESPECLIELRIEVITCVHPLDSFADDHLRFSCSTPRLGYIYGTSCNLSCTANLPLNGSDIITCEDNGKSEGNWSLSGEEPFCREISCPELEPPVNGALVHDTVLTRPMRQLICNDNYDIPDLGTIPFNGILWCTDNGDWTPFQTVPNCIEPRNPRFIKLPAEIFYYGGECGTEETMAQIEANFKALMIANIDPYFAVICPLGLTCTANDIVITCGPIKSRKKRSGVSGDSSRQLRSSQIVNVPSRDHIIAKRDAETHSLIVEFNIVTSINMTNSSLQDAVKFIDEMQIQILVPVFNEMLKNGTFDIDNYVLKSESVSTPDYGTVTCDDNYIWYQSKCKPCPIGYFLNKTSNMCHECPVGQFKDNESDSNCLSCPSGYSTRLSGSTSYNDCVKLCRPGTYSPDKFETCSTCRHGFFQDEYGQTTCKQCPDGTTTVSTNSSSKSDCKNFDVHLKTTNGDVTVAVLAEILTNFTFMFWTKTIDKQTSNASMTLTSGGLTLISLFWNTYLRVQIQSLLNKTIASHSSSKWSHVAITWDTSKSQVTLYSNGAVVNTLSSNSSQISPLIQTGALTVTSNSNTGISLAGLHLIRDILPETEIANQAKSCHTTETNDVINMGSFVGSTNQGISLVVESSCYAYDECLSSPCNGHVCTNGLGRYTCTCQRGWSGTNCTTPPDLCIDNACKNGATCVSESTNYTCTCVPGYSGPFCEIPPVNGGWSDWSESVCSKTCGSGRINRTRQCDSPAPGVYGNDCVGAAVEIISCNMQTCPACKEFKIALGTVLKCYTDAITGSQTCTMECEAGKVLPPGLTDLQSYTCGPSTNYEWDNFENPPGCIEPISPLKLNITVNVIYATEIQENATSDFKKHINDQISGVPCFDSANCETDIDINQSIMTIGFSISTTEGQDLHYSDFISTGEPSDSLKEITDAINYLEQTGIYIQNNKAELFDVTVDNVRYTVADENPIIYVGVACDGGFMAINGTCVKCPAGTYSFGEKCSFCEKGKYQPNTGEATCISCPPYQTTNAIGSTDSSQCISFDACSLSPCNGHVCTNGQNGYICSCENGWSGTNCKTPPNLCISNACVNGATCISLSTNYTCECTPGYSGQFCEITPINGGWSEWSQAKCSKTCGTGVMYRTRKCDNPVPDKNGADCVGEAKETKDCNVKDCPVDENLVTILIVVPVVAILVVSLSVALFCYKRLRHSLQREKSSDTRDKILRLSSPPQETDIEKGSDFEDIDRNANVSTL